MRVFGILGVSILLGLAATAAPAAGPTDPVTVTSPPSGVGDAFSPGVRLVADLGAACDEFDDGIGDDLTCEPTLQ